MSMVYFNAEITGATRQYKEALFASVQWLHEYSMPQNIFTDKECPEEKIDHWIIIRGEKESLDKTFQELYEKYKFVPVLNEIDPSDEHFFAERPYKDLFEEKYTGE